MKRLAAWNSVAALCVLAAPARFLPGPLSMAAAAALVLILPGGTWLGFCSRQKLDAPRLALATVGLSSLAAVLGTALGALLLGAPSRIFLAGWCFLVLNTGLLLTTRRPVRLDRETPWGSLAALLAAGFAIISLTGMYVVPPLEDHDMEVRGTAWGLAADFKPYFQTNRQVYFPLAHPLLFHIHVADSLIFTDQIEATLPSYASGRRAETAADSGREVPWMDWWKADYQAFVKQPALAGTRAAPALLGALVLVLLADMVRRFTGSTAAGMAAAALYLSSPETLVRSSYAGYFSVTVFAMLAAVLLLIRSRPDQPALGWLVAAGAFAALVDHKTVVLILGITALAGWQTLAHIRRSGRPTDLLAWWRAQHPGRRALALGAGFTGGTFLWWSYAAILDTPTFIQDHLRMHIAHRFLLNDIRLISDPGRYAPSIPAMWGEFAAHTGYLLLPVALLGFVVWAWRGQQRETSAVLLVWFLTGAVLYSLTDWRQTKHLMNQLAPLVTAAVLLAWPATGLPAQGVRSRGLTWVAAAALAIALMINVAADVRLVADFSSLNISGASDVDGW